MTKTSHNSKGLELCTYKACRFSRIADRIVSAASTGGRGEESRGLGGLPGGFISGDE